MQVKKEEMRERILQEAEIEFASAGYVHASVRQIAKKAGMTIGNLYRYFEGKEALFETLVEGPYRMLMAQLAEHAEEQRSEGFPTDIEPGWFREAIENAVETVFPMFSVRFLLLMDAAGGSKYAEARTALIGTFGIHAAEHMFGAGKLDEQGERFGRLLAGQFVDGAVAVLKSEVSDSEKKQMLTDWMWLMLSGVQACSTSRAAVTGADGTVAAVKQKEETHD